ncbi:MAG: hypothetical protein ABIP03_06040 [Aquihabitans sp.]
MNGWEFVSAACAVFVACAVLVTALFVAVGSWVNRHAGDDD